MYLDMPDVDSFKQELIDRKVKEVRITPLKQNIPQNPVMLVNIIAVFTATDGRDIIRFVDESIGKPVPIVYEEGIKELQNSINAFMINAAKIFKAAKIEVKKGIYKYPSEMS
jgi:hypothetical protein